MPDHPADEEDKKFKRRFSEQTRLGGRPAGSGSTVDSLRVAFEDKLGSVFPEGLVDELNVGGFEGSRGARGGQIRAEDDGRWVDPGQRNERLGHVEIDAAEGLFRVVAE